MNGLCKTTALGLMALTLAGAGCGRVTDYVSDNPRTTIGATVGTLGGAIIGGTVFDSAGAAVAGGLIGALGGGLIGRALEAKNEDYDRTSRDYSTREALGTFLNVEDVDADPQRARAGNTVNLVTRYAVLPEQRNREVRVTERWVITHNGRVVGTPSLIVTRSGGTWSSAIPLNLPASADPGMYRAQVTVEADGARDQGSTTFNLG